MRPTILLFDVDGTLICTGGAGRRAIARALSAYCARRGADLAPSALSFPFGGMTDRAIVRAGLEGSGLSSAEPNIDEVLSLYLEVLREEVARAAAADYRVHDGIGAALDAACARPSFAVGLGTGNIEPGARIKLGRVGLAARFAFGGFGCDSEDRATLLRAGAERGAAILRRPLSECRVVVIGDTSRDVAAAQAIGAESLAIATGFEPIDSLRAREPTFAFASLAARGAIEAMMGD